MLRALRGHLTYANVMATIAVFVALGGSTYAAATITGRDIKDASLTGKDIKRNSLTGAASRASKPSRRRAHGYRARLRAGGLRR